MGTNLTQAPAPSGLPFSLGRLQANAVASARTSGENRRGAPGPRQVFQAVGFYPATTPFAHPPVTTACMAGICLIAPIRMLMGNQIDLGSIDLALRVSSDN